MQIDQGALFGQQGKCIFWRLALEYQLSLTIKGQRVLYRGLRRGSRGLSCRFPPRSDRRCQNIACKCDQLICFLSAPKTAFAFGQKQQAAR